ncbi:hypothetical protein V502_07830 [Pseudogymnoascus sp. VKM F-4520 (FW-2644)]|nr:hypothetical protein V502_07830 [Pseudogymnoascus sp. VKM F-4520 (FW-2644)]
MGCAMELSFVHDVNRLIEFGVVSEDQLVRIGCDAVYRRTDHTRPWQTVDILGNGTVIPVFRPLHVLSQSIDGVIPWSPVDEENRLQTGPSRRENSGAGGEGYTPTRTVSLPPLPCHLFDSAHNTSPTAQLQSCRLAQKKAKTSEKYAKDALAEIKKLADAIDRIHRVQKSLGRDSTCHTEPARTRAERSAADQAAVEKLTKDDAAEKLQQAVEELKQATKVFEEEKVRLKKRGGESPSREERRRKSVSRRRLLMTRPRVRWKETVVGSSI